MPCNIPGLTLNYLEISGAADRTRTYDPIITNDMSRFVSISRVGHFVKKYQIVACSDVSVLFGP